MVLKTVFLFGCACSCCACKCGTAHEVCSRKSTFHVQDTSATSFADTASSSASATPSKLPLDARKKLFTFKPPTASVRKAAASATVTSTDVCATTYQDFAEELSGV